MKIASQKSVEPNVADLVNGWLKAYGLDYKLEQESLNPKSTRHLKSIIPKAAALAAIVQTQSFFYETQIFPIGQSS